MMNLFTELRSEKIHADTECPVCKKIKNISFITFADGYSGYCPECGELIYIVEPFKNEEK